jgi:hypothetical protein
MSNARAGGSRKQEKPLTYWPTKGAKFAALKTEIADVDRRIGRAEALAAAERAAPAIIDRHGDGAFEERAREFSLRKAIVATLLPILAGESMQVLSGRSRKR